MDPKAPVHLKLGDVINGTVVKPIGGRRFAVTTTETPRGWAVELQSRTPEKVKIGIQTTMWVGRLNPHQAKILVHDGDFGQLPISQAMAARYRAGLDALLGGSELTGDTLADVRAMVSRLSTRDQADWLTVWRLLGEPSSATVQELTQHLTALREARKEAPDTVPDIMAKITEKFGPMLERALRRL